MARRPRLPKYTQRIGVSQEDKSEKVWAFLAPLMNIGEQRALVLDVLDMRTQGGNSEKLSQMQEKHGAEAWSEMNRRLFNLVGECQSDFDEIRILVREQLGIVDEGDDITAELDPDGLAATLVRPREAVEQVIHVAPGEQVSPWVVKPKLSHAEILAAFSDEELEILKRERTQEKEGGFDGGSLVVGTMMARWTRQVLENGLNPKDYLVELDLRLSGESLSASQAGAPFVRKRNENGEVRERSPWEEENFPKILEEATALVADFEEADRALFEAVIYTENPKDIDEVKRMIRRHAPEATLADYREMSRFIERKAGRFARIMRRAPEDIQKAVFLKVAGARVLPAGLPGMTAEEARRAPTRLSTEKQKSIVARIRHRLRGKKP